MAHLLPPSPAEEFDKLLTQVRTYLPDPLMLESIQKAYEFSADKHANQKRVSGEPYILHPIAVAQILTEFNVDAPTLIAAILHDIVEDTDVPIETIEKLFGKTVATLVGGLTKIAKIQFSSTQHRMAENFRKMVLAMAKDLRVIVIKLADRLHNMRTLGSLAPEKRRRIAEETLEIYAPLANRLGIYGFKSELEDLCLKETKNQAYREISKKVAAKKQEREREILDIKTVLQEELQKYPFDTASVYGRPKHFYSIYKKMVDRELAFEDIHDLFAFRIIVGSVKECYEALGVLHAIWKPMPGRFKDYIAMPKANLYQSLHTTIVRPNGTPVEIQIRTREMHHICEFGVAAHWSYKERNSTPHTTTDLQRFSWLRHMMELQHDVQDPNEFLAAVKLDLFEEEIFVFTPKGDVVQLPTGATALDFAFAVHTDVGLHTVATKVNGRILPLRGKLSNGDIVEVLTATSQAPSKDWLNFVISSKARNKIRSHLRSEQREKSLQMGRDLLLHELEKRGVTYDALFRTGQIDKLAKAAKESSPEELFIAIGYGRISSKDLLAKVLPSPEEPSRLRLSPSDVAVPTAQPVRPPKNAPSGILVSGLDNILVAFGRCCSPLPGESIIGFITRGRGVSVHRNTCPRALDLDPVRRIDVQWADPALSKEKHNAYLRVVTQDRQGILAEITLAISGCGANIKKAQVRVSPNMMGILDFELDIHNLDQLHRVIAKIEAVSNVVFVERKTGGS